VAVRERPFQDLGEFARRINARAVNKRVLESLVAAGAFDELERERARATAAIDIVAGDRATHAGRRGERPGRIVRQLCRAEPIKVPEVPGWLPAERLQREYDAVGFFLTGHPLDDYAGLLESMRVQSWAAFSRAVKAGVTPAGSPRPWCRERNGAPRPATRWALSGYRIRPVNMKL